jgi:hypothetical protein
VVALDGDGNPLPPRRGVAPAQHIPPSHDYR